MRYLPLFLIALVPLVGYADEGGGAEYQNEEQPSEHAEEPLMTEEVSREELSKQDLKNKEIILANLKGIVLTSSNEVPEGSVSGRTGVTFQDMSRSGLKPKLQQQLRKDLENKYINKPVSMDSLNEMKGDIYAFYKRSKRPFVVIQLPEQEISSGVVVISVHQSKVGKINIRGNKWFKDDYYRQWMSLYESQPVNSDVLIDDLTWHNRSPFIHADYVFSPGEKPYTTDVDLVVEDFRPFKAYAGTDSTGFDITDRTRVFAGINWGNLFNKGQILSAQYTAAPDFKKYQSITLNYTIPLPWKDLMIFYGGYSLTKTPASNTDLHLNRGQNWQGSGRYVFPRPIEETLLQEFQAGFDFKRMNNDVLFGENILSTKVASLFQFVGTYNLSKRWQHQMVSFDGQGFFSPGQLSSSMSRETLGLLRPGAQNLYLYGRLAMNYLYSFPQDWLFDFKTTAQFSTGALLPSEMLGLGGMYSVRGYEEHQVNVDNGFIFNFEFRSPKVSLLKFCNPKYTEDRWSAVAFYDMGMGWEDKQVGDLGWSYFLGGIGPGMRFSIGEWMYARVDWAYRLAKVPNDDHWNRWYFSFVANY